MHITINNLKLVNSNLIKGMEKTKDNSPLVHQLRTTVDHLKSDNLNLKTEIAKFRKSTKELKKKSVNSKLDKEMAEMRKSREELMKKNEFLTIELADNKTKLYQQSIIEQNLHKEIKQLKKEYVIKQFYILILNVFPKRNRNKIIQLRLKDSEQCQASSAEKMKDMETRLKQVVANQQEMTKRITVNDQKLAESQKQVKDLEKLQDVQAQQSSRHESDQLQIR